MSDLDGKVFDLGAARATRMRRRGCEEVGADIGPTIFTSHCSGAMHYVENVPGPCECGEVFWDAQGVVHPDGSIAFHWATA